MGRDAGICLRGVDKDTVDAVSVRQKAIIRQLVQDPQEDKDAHSNAGCKSENVDECVALVPQ